MLANVRSNIVRNRCCADMGCVMFSSAHGDSHLAHGTPRKCVKHRFYVHCSLHAALLDCISEQVCMYEE